VLDTRQSSHQKQYAIPTEVQLTERRAAAVQESQERHGVVALRAPRVDVRPAPLRQPAHLVRCFSLETRIG
jgi:hypothetical protein